MMGDTVRFDWTGGGDEGGGAAPSAAGEAAGAAPPQRRNAVTRAWPPSERDEFCANLRERLPEVEC